MQTSGASKASTRGPKEGSEFKVSAFFFWGGGGGGGFRMPGASSG